MAFDRKAYMQEYNKRPDQREKQRKREKIYRDKIASTPEGLAMWREKKKAYSATPEGKRKNRNRVLRFHYGITLEDYERMSIAQDHSCAICGTDAWMEQYGVLHVDHDHETGAIRGLLCSKCNTGLGLFSDAPSRLRAAAQYLERF